EITVEPVRHPKKDPSEAE
nr:RecName: Full=Scolopendra 5971.33 Da toxin [Scolopendra angulata]